MKEPITKERLAAMPRGRAIALLGLYSREQLFALASSWHLIVKGADKDTIILRIMKHITPPKLGDMLLKPCGCAERAAARQKTLFDEPSQDEDPGQGGPLYSDPR